MESRAACCPNAKAPRTEGDLPTRRAPAGHACPGDVVIRTHAVNAQHRRPGIGLCGHAEGSYHGSGAQRLLERSAGLKKKKKERPPRTAATSRRKTSPITSARTPPVGFVSATMRPRRNARTKSCGTAPCASLAAAEARSSVACSLSRRTRRCSLVQPEGPAAAPRRARRKLSRAVAVRRW